ERALVHKEEPVKRLSLALVMALVVSAVATVAWAQQPAGPPPAAAAAAAAPAASKIDKGDTAWMLTSSALVLLMTAPGLALFYGGMVRQKNALATLMQSFIILAVITPALITGAFAERKKFSAFLLFTVLWATFVYDPLAHWVWGDGGWLKKLGALDFAGGTVVHISSGMSALVCAIMLGKRRGY